MQKLYTKEDCHQFRKKFKTLGFAPTMGNLHQGHISLLQKALEDNDAAVISIYVNPTQFAQGEDFDKYPRTLEEDLERISELEKKFPHKSIGVFLPDNKTMYPEGEKVTIKVPELSNILEGKMRPTHFDGVTTIVHRLFDFVDPTKAYFGQKDYQQLKIIEKMVEKLQLHIEIVPMPIMRDQDNLAMSSRNRYLSSEERKLALTLPKTLVLLESLIKNKEIRKARLYIHENLMHDKNWNYLEIRDAKTLAETIELTDDVVILGNYQLGKTKLLDNRIIKYI